MDERWMIHTKKLDFDEFSKEFNISKPLARIIRNRGLTTKDEFKRYLSDDLSLLYDPFLLKDMDKAIDYIIKAMEEKKKIRVVGDYDVDGVCSGFILTNSLKKLGADVSFTVPDRIIDGYGINERIIDVAKEDGIELIITCDNGIAAKNQVDYALKLGIDIIVTDHHEVPFVMENDEKKYIIPNALAVVDHKRKDCEYPFKELCGAAIAFKVIMALCEKMDTDEKLKEEIFNLNLIFASIATIADIVPLKDENRIIVKNGLKRIKKSNNKGLDALIDINNLREKDIGSYHIGFIIGPTINAAGRLKNAELAFELFSTDDYIKAKEIGMHLKTLNDERKEMTINGTCEGIIKADERIKSDDVLVVYLGDIHESVAGIVAGKLKEKYYRPVFVLTNTESFYKGSARSIEGFDIFEEMTKANSKYKEEKNEELIYKFGGHKMAAGLTIKKDKLDDFIKYMNLKSLDKDILIKNIWIDFKLPFEYISEDFINELKKIEPCGAENEKPQFAEVITHISSLKVFGENKNVISLKLKNESGYTMNATIFEKEEEFFDKIKKKYDDNVIDGMRSFMGEDINLKIIYYPEINEYNNKKYIKVVIKNYSW